MVFPQVWLRIVFSVLYYLDRMLSDIIHGAGYPALVKRYSWSKEDRVADKWVRVTPTRNYHMNFTGNISKATSQGLLKAIQICNYSHAFSLKMGP